ncbi:MAG: F0F1 ATP synthase subunit B [Candidatus Acetothermia bacterium]
MELSWQKVVESLNFTLVANLVNFGLLVGILSWLLYRPAREFMEKRREKISSRIASAKDREEEASELVEERAEELREARRRAQQIIENAEETAQQIKEKGTRQAEEEAERIIKKAREEAQRERERVREELREEYLDAALLGAKAILSREVNEEDHRRMVDSLFAELEEGEIDFS